MEPSQRCWAHNHFELGGGATCAGGPIPASNNIHTLSLSNGLKTCHRNTEEFFQALMRVAVTTIGNLLER